MDACLGVVQRPADNQCRILLAVSGVWSRVDQNIVSLAGTNTGRAFHPIIPIDLKTLRKPGIVRQTLPVAEPILTPHILAHAHGVKPALLNARSIKRINAVGGAGGDGMNRLVWQPIHVVLEHGAEVTGSAAHDVVGVSVIFRGLIAIQS